MTSQVAPIDLHERQSLLQEINQALGCLCKKNPALRSSSRFQSLIAPPRPFRDYIRRIDKYSHCSNEALVISMIYLDRIAEANPNHQITDLTVHRLFLTSIRIANKYHDDLHMDNAHFAKIGGMDTKNFSNMEFEFLANLQFKLYVDPDEYIRRKKTLLEP